MQRRPVVWPPEFWEFPEWAADADLMFADAAGWARPIRFAGRVGGHASVLATAERARRSGVRRLVLAHIGRPSIRAMEKGLQPPFGNGASTGGRTGSTDPPDVAPRRPGPWGHSVDVTGSAPVRLGRVQRLCLDRGAAANAAAHAVRRSR